ncbi:glycosyltransferase [Namhaeicola litoreus]|uniref:Glycosyltransferase n=1 Tax=Namhaeicola litoreus TaxID=1052145 RepID=A0ABW3Y3U2_9FLAO
MSRDLHFSLIIPVYNRKDELQELLHTVVNQNFNGQFEVIVIDDGSADPSKEVAIYFSDKLNLHYYFKENSGPGDSRNFGMKMAKGNYFIVLDSDCLLPENYLSTVSKVLEKNYTDAFGAPDTAHPSFSRIQKAINFSMTSFITTGGLRNEESKNRKFQLRSFNMGISKTVFEKTGGFANQYIGEDIELTMRIWNMGFTTQFIPDAFVYHKRRTNFRQFYKQTNNFGAARPILNELYPNSKKITYWFPSFFVIFFIISMVLFFFGIGLPLKIILGYLILVLIDSTFENRSLLTGLLSIVSTLIQFFGYGIGFLRTMFRKKILSQNNMTAFPKMFSK